MQSFYKVVQQHENYPDEGSGIQSKRFYYKDLYNEVNFPKCPLIDDTVSPTCGELKMKTAPTEIEHRKLR